MKTLDVIAAVLVVVGTANWGLVGVANFDLVATIFGMSFGQISVLSSIVYSLVGIAGLYQGLLWKSIRHRWQSEQGLAAAR